MGAVPHALLLRHCQTFAFLRQHGLLPQADGVEHLLRVLARVRDSSRATRVLREAIREGIAPTTRSFEHALEAACRANDSTAQREVFRLARVSTPLLLFSRQI